MSRYRGGCSDPTCEDCQQEWGLFPEPERRSLAVADRAIVQLAWGDEEGTVTALFETDGHPMGADERICDI